MFPFLASMALVFLGFCLGAVWSSEVHARKPSPTGWRIETITSLPRATARPAVTRRRSWVEWRTNKGDGQ
jgi:hypothetical protein